MRQLLTCAIVSICMLSPTFSHAQKKQTPIVAVFLMESRGSPLKADEVVGLTDYLSTLLGQGGRYQIIPRDEIRKRMAEVKSGSYKDCIDQSCQIEIGRELAAQYTVSTSISKVGTRCLITAALYDLRRAATVKTVAIKKSCVPDRLVEAVEKVNDVLQKAMDTDKPGPIAEKPEPRPEPVPQPKIPPPQPTIPAPQPDPPPYVAPTSSVAPSTGWAMGAGIAGLISAVAVLGLGVGSEMAAHDGTRNYCDEYDCYEEGDTDKALTLGGAATGILAIMGPVVFSGARSPKGDGVWGVGALRVVGWITYGVGLALAGGQLVLGLTDEDVPEGFIAATGVVCATSLTMFSIDAFIARGQASRLMAVVPKANPDSTSFAYQPVVTPVYSLDGSGTATGATFGLAGRF